MNQLELNQKNRTIRKFRNQDIPAADLDYIAENLRYCHCANNLQRLRYIFVSSEEYREKAAALVHYAALLPKEIGTPKKGEEPHAYCIITKPKGTGGAVDIDAGIAAQVITASAFERGLGSCIIMNFRAEEMNQAMHIEPDRTAVLAVSLGYPAVASTAEDVQDNILAYHVDEEGNWHVPKLSADVLIKKL